MVKIADVLEQRRFKSSPCVAHVSQTQPTRVLSYRDAWKALKEHEKWFKGVLLLSEEASSTDYDDVVLAYLSSNSTDMMISMLASTSSTSVVVALLNTRWTPSEMAAVLQTASSSSRTILLYSSEFRDKALETQSILKHVTQLVQLPLLSNNYLKRYESNGSRSITTTSDEEIDAQIRTCADMDSDQDDDALLVFTSGTTSGSKGVRLSHTALWIQALAKLRNPCRYSSTTHMLSNTVPLFHVGGLSSTLALWLAGGTWMVPTTDGDTTKGFDPSTVLKLASHPVVPTNTLVVVPAMLHSLLQQVEEGMSYPDVELILIGGQSAPDDMLTRLRLVFPNARLVQTYACTEAASSMTFHEPSSAADDQALPIAGDCVGTPPPHVQLQLVQRNEETGQVVIVKEPYQVGILATSGPHVMNGYWKRQKGNQLSSASKWFLTNDLGFRDDGGCYYFCGRGKDVIRTGGETVIALEVERVLLQQQDSGISECAVFALPDDRFGEAVCVAIVMKTKQPLLPLQDIRNRYCQSLAGYKRPRRLFFVDALPRNSSGKVLKYKLVEQFTAPTKSKL